MAQDATKIFSGPVTAIELSANGSSYTDIGYGTANAEITWEPAPQELSEGNQIQLAGLGKIKVEMVQTDSGTLATVKSYRTSKAYVRLTTAEAKTFVVSGIFLAYALKRGMKAGESHILTITGQKYTINPDDFCAFPA